jgi:hypothetical protein
MRIHLVFLLILFPVSIYFTNHPEQPASFVPVKVDTVSDQGLFDTDDVLQITLKGNIRDLLNDRTAEPKLFPIVLSYQKGDNSEVAIEAKAKTRGHFRRLRDNCKFPPLLIQFTKKGPQQNTLFSEQKKLKLVMPCTGDDFVVREWLAYKIYNLVTPYSFKARLVEVKLEDEQNKKSFDPFYGILLEEEKQMATRNKAVVVDKKLQPKQIKEDAFFRMSVFQYLIGNTDWSIQYQQNIKLVSPESGDSIIAVPYDFDHSGLVNAPYAHPAEELLMSSVRQRRFRGYCIQDLNKYNEVLAEFNRLKNEIYSLFTNCALLDQKYLKSNMQWMDDFYKTISNDKAWHKDFAYPCDKNGTGNVVIKGLKED